MPQDTLHSSVGCPLFKLFSLSLFFYPDLPCFTGSQLGTRLENNSEAETVAQRKLAF